MSEWQPIESAPRDGSIIVGWRDGWDAPALLRWKVNERIARVPKNDRDGRRPQYFGDLWEMDDYGLAFPEDHPDYVGPTHWLYVPPTPSGPNYFVGADNCANTKYGLTPPLLDPHRNQIPSADRNEGPCEA